MKRKHDDVLRWLTNKFIYYGIKKKHNCIGNESGVEKVYTSKVRDKLKKNRKDITYSIADRLKRCPSNIFGALKNIHLFHCDVIY